MASKAPKISNFVRRRAAKDIYAGRVFSEGIMDSPGKVQCQYCNIVGQGANNLRGQRDLHQSRRCLQNKVWAAVDAVNQANQK